MISPDSFAYPMLTSFLGNVGGEYAANVLKPNGEATVTL